MDQLGDEISSNDYTASPSYLVREFHKVMGIPILGCPGPHLLKDQRLVRKIMGMLRQEVGEVEDETRKLDIDGVGIELADVVLTAYGAALELGIDLDEKIRQKHEANLTRRSPDGKVFRSPDGKIEKGPHYRPPGSA